MKTIVFCGTKGGCGKSTLALNIAIEASRHGTVYLADLDPQQSLRRLCELRGHQPDLLGHQPVLLTDVRDLAGAVRKLEESGYARDYLIVDTPGSFVDEIIKPALRAADCAVLPVQPSPLDIFSQEDLIPSLGDLGKIDRSMFVVNRMDGRADVKDLVKRIASLLPNPIAEVKQRQAYMRGAVAGLAGFEVASDCLLETRALWAAISQILRKTRDGKIQHGRSHAVVPAGTT